MLNLDDLAARPHARSPRECQVAYAMRTLTESQADALARAIDNPSVRHAEIAAALIALGYSTNDTNIGRHRRHLCQCRRAA